METRPALASEEEGRNKNTPLQLATLWGRIDVVREYCWNTIGL